MAGSRYCSICPSGFYCPCTECSPIMCPSNSVCPTGSVEFIECSPPFSYVKNVNDHSCSHSFQFYLIIFGSIFAFMILVLTAFFSLRRRRKKLNESAALKQRLTDTKDPLYHGY